MVQENGTEEQQKQQEAVPEIPEQATQDVSGSEGQDNAGTGGLGLAHDEPLVRHSDVLDLLYGVRLEHLAKAAEEEVKAAGDVILIAAYKRIANLMGDLMLKVEGLVTWTTDEIVLVRDLTKSLSTLTMPAPEQPPLDVQEGLIIHDESGVQSNEGGTSQSTSGSTTLSPNPDSQPDSQLS